MRLLEDKGLRTTLLMCVGGTAVGLLGFGGYELYVHHGGATVDDLANVDLARPMSAVESDLPATHRHASSITVRFRDSVPSYTAADIRFDDATHGAYSIELERAADEHHSTKKSEHGDSNAAKKLERWFRDVAADGSWSWGAVSFSVGNESMIFRVKPDADNPGLHRMVDAAREVLLAVAFGRAPKTADAELAALLGAGYAVSVVGAIDPTQDFEAHATDLRARFPSAIKHIRRLEIPVDHPSVRSVQLEWDGRGLETLRLKVTGDGGLRACLLPKLPSPGTSVDANEIRVDIRRTSLAMFATTLQSVDACR